MKSWFTVLGFILFAFPPCMAQKEDVIEDLQEVIRLEESPPSGGPRSGWSVDLEALSFFEAEADDLDVEMLRTRLRIGRTEVLSRKAILFYGADWEHSFYDFDGFSNYLPSLDTRDVEDFDRIGVRAGFAYRFDQKWGAFLQLTGGFSGDLGADFGKSLRGGAIGGAEWRPNEDLTLRFGVGAFNRIEEDPLVIPAITVNWKIDPQWTLDLGFPESTLRWRPQDEWTFSFGARFDFRDFRMDSDGRFEDAVLRDDAIRLELGAEWSPNPGMTLGLGIGLPVWREITIDDSDGNEILEADFDPAPTLRLELRLQF